MADRHSVEQLYQPHLRGVPTAGMSLAGISEPFVGRTTIDSGSTSVVVSSTLVQSDSIFLLSVEAGSIGTNSAGAIVVASIVDSVSFAFARANNVAQQWDDVVMWQLWRT